MLNKALTLALGCAVFLSTLVTVAVLSPAPFAVADECIPSTTPDGVMIPCEDEGGETPGGGEDPGDNSGGGAPQRCDHLGEEIPCSSPYGSWDGDCYVRAAVPQPPKGSGAWEGNDEGYILECTPYACAQAGGDLTNCPGHAFYWSPEAPAAAGPSAEELARRAVVNMGLATGDLGSTPPPATSDANTVGAVGLPIWLWIADRQDNTIGPIERREPGGGLLVTAVGTLDRVEWSLVDANGTTVGAVTCSGPNAAGTPYDGRNSAEPSPTCGFGADLNGRPGTLTLTGTAHWSVEWQGGGQSGHIDFTAESKSAQIRIGELQALVQD